MREKSMNVYVIYKQITDMKTGEVESIEIIEPCSTEKEAHSFSRLYHLQTPNDMKDKTTFSHYRVVVNPSKSSRSTAYNIEEYIGFNPPPLVEVVI